MNFISKKTVGDVELVLSKEAVSEIGKEKLELLLESDNLDVYEILVEWRYDRKEAASRRQLCSLQRKYNYVSHFDMGVIRTVEVDECKLVKPPNSKRPVQSFDFPIVLAKIQWKSDASLNGLYVLVDKIQQSKRVDPVEFVKSMRDDISRVYEAVMADRKKDELAFNTDELALNRAVVFLKKNPSKYIFAEYLTKEMFPLDKDPRRTFKANMANAVLIKNGYAKISQNKIISMLSK